MTHLSQLLDRAAAKKALGKLAAPDDLEKSNRSGARRRASYVP
jgi:hypothetical protein